MRRALAVGLGLALAATAAAQLAPATGQPSDARPALLREVRIDQRLGQTLPLDAIFRDEAGRPVRLGQYFGTKPVVLVLAYYDCPMLCTQVLNGLLSALRVLSFDVGREFEVVTVSFDPRETPRDAAAKKKPYLEAYHRPNASEGWHFLTGSAAPIERLTSAVGFHYEFDESIGQFAHASAIYVATPDGRLSRYLYGIDYAPRDLRLALIEASARKIGNPVDSILLYCYHYDPKSGRYGAVVLNMVRLGGIGAVVLLGGFILAMLRRDRRRAATRTGAAAALERGAP